MEKAWKIWILGKTYRHPCDSLGSRDPSQTLSWRAPLLTAWLMPCTWDISLIPSQDFYGTFTPRMGCSPRVTFGQIKALITPSSSSEPKEINPNVSRSDSVKAHWHGHKDQGKKQYHLVPQALFQWSKVQPGQTACVWSQPNWKCTHMWSVFSLETQIAKDQVPLCCN